MSIRSDDDAPILEPELMSAETPAGIDRRSFIVRSAMIGSVAVLSGSKAATAKETADQAASAPPVQPRVKLSPDLEVVKKSKGPVMTTVEEFYKVGPGPSSSHTIGPMRITYDFYQRCTKLPPDQLAKATALTRPSVRQPERHRQRTRHRARRARRHHRQGAGDDRSAVPRRDGRQARPDVSGDSSAAPPSTPRSRTSSTTRPRATSRTPTR